MAHIPTSLQGQRILVMESDPLLLMVWIKKLKSWGLNPSGLRTPSEFWEKRSWPYAAVLVNRAFLAKLPDPALTEILAEETPPKIFIYQEIAGQSLQKLPLAQEKNGIQVLVMPQSEKDWENLRISFEQFIFPTNTPLQSLDPLVQLLSPYLLFQSAEMVKSLRFLPKIAAAPYPVLLQGESGTGKELVAQAIHQLSPKADQTIISLNCGAIPENLIESELFGHEKGSFTGAVGQHIGVFEQAKDGTLFLDEIGEMPLNLQVRLLRVLETGQMQRVGGNKTIKARPRIIAATQVHLEQAVEKGLFRADLYYRLNVLFIRLPPLRVRLEDIELLARAFLNRTFSELNYSKPYPVLHEDTLRLLKGHYWPGNVRELKNLMTRVATLVPARLESILPKHLWLILARENQMGLWQETQKPNPIDKVSPEKNTQLFDDSPTNMSGQDLALAYGLSLKQAKQAWIDFNLAKHNGNVSAASAVLGISPRHLRRILMNNPRKNNIYKNTAK